jgi:hypothetical protein
MASNTFRSAFTKADLMQGATIVCALGQFNRLGVYNVQAGELVSPGYAGQSGQDNAQGRLYVKLQDATPAVANGLLRLSIFSPQDRPLEIIQEWRTETLNTSATDRSLQVPFPEYDAWISEDKKVVLEFKPDAGVTLTVANCTVLMDVTKATV